MPDAPNFSYTYYSTYTSFVGTAAKWLGIFLYQEFLSMSTFRNITLFAPAIRALAGLFDYIMVERLSVVFGIPDRVMYLFGDTIVPTLIQHLNSMPIMTHVKALPSRDGEEGWRRHSTQ